MGNLRYDVDEMDCQLIQEERRKMNAAIQAMVGSLAGLTIEQRIIFEKGIKTGYLTALVLDKEDEIV